MKPLLPQPGGSPQALGSVNRRSKPRLRVHPVNRLATPWHLMFDCSCSRAHATSQLLVPSELVTMNVVKEDTSMFATGPGG
jgi:hypothetical protein